MRTAPRSSYRTVLLIGGVGGLGEAIAKHLSVDGTMILVADFDLAAAEAVAGTVTRQGGQSTPLRITSLASQPCMEFISTLVHHWGPVDVLVNDTTRSGPGTGRRDHEIDEAEVESMSLATAQDMRSRGGSIINVLDALSSGVEGMVATTKDLAVHMLGEGVRVNAVAYDGPVTDADTLRARQSLLPRQGRYVDAAHAVAFLAGREASFITGEVLRVDGGRLLERTT